MNPTILVLLAQHGHGQEQSQREIGNVLRLFPGIYDSYRKGQDLFGPGVVVYAPEAHKDAGYAPLKDLQQDPAVVDAIHMLQDKTPDLNHVPVLFIYACGHIAGYIVTGGYGIEPGQPNIAEITWQMYGRLQNVQTPQTIGDDLPSDTEPWEMDL